MDSRLIDAMTRAQASSHGKWPRHSALRRVALAGLVLAFSVNPVAAQSLQGSAASLDRQDAAARRNDFTFIDTPARLRYFVDQGWLVRVRPNRDFDLHAVSYPYARPEVALFITRLAAQYRAACGSKLVVTSLTRPTTRQPRNASDRSVHPTGMAADLRYSSNRACRRWLEGVLTDLEGAGILEATRERYPAHYHVAVFPKRYASYVQSLLKRATRPTRAVLAQVPYEVRPGDSLWAIAHSHGTTVDALKDINGIKGSRIYAGQVLELPGTR